MRLEIYAHCIMLPKLVHKGLPIEHTKGFSVLTYLN